MNTAKSALHFSSPIEAETAFYNAFSNSSVTGMDQVWSGDDVVCIHPGSAALVGKEAVMKSWARILMAEAAPKISFEIIKQVYSGELAVHLVREIITVGAGSATVIATNIYQQGDQGWKMIEHHGSQAVVEHRGAREENKTAAVKKHTLQ